MSLTNSIIFLCLFLCFAYGQTGVEEEDDCDAYTVSFKYYPHAMTKLSIRSTNPLKLRAEVKIKIALILSLLKVWFVVRSGTTQPA